VTTERDRAGGVHVTAGSVVDVLAELPAGASAQVAGEVVGTPQYGGPPLRSTSTRVGAARLRCASLLKPLYAWAAAHCGPYDADPARWAVDAEQAVRHSDNAATNRLWFAATPPRVLGWLAGATGVRWQQPGVDPHWFGTVEVTATEVVTAYGALARAAAGDPAAARLLGWMRDVDPGQALGVPAVVAAAAGVEPGGVAVKSGWFGHTDETCLRTHVVAVAERPVGPGVETLVLAALTALPAPEADRERYRRDLTAGRPVEGEHERLAGPAVRNLVAAACRDLVRVGPT
jgi:hypothetical protein